jgi:hypothetical protein
MQQAAVGGLHGDLADPALWVGGQRAGSGCGVEDTTVTAARNSPACNLSLQPCGDPKLGTAGADRYQIYIYCATGHGN